MTRPSEDELIACYFAPMAGAGGLSLRDDAAVIKPKPGHDIVVSKDVLVAGCHFFPDDPAESIARKALRVNLSDLAAKGAVPTGFVLGLVLPDDWTEDWIQRFAEGLRDDAALFQCPLIGGDTVSTSGPLVVSITVFGEVDVGRMVPRTGCRAGDILYVTGTIGDAALGLRFRSKPAIGGDWEALVQRYLLPEPRLPFAGALAHVRAAMDVSDGFVGDLEKMLGLEKLTAEVDIEDIPLSKAVATVIAGDPALLTLALTGGDDYEILCAVSPESEADFIRAAERSGVRFSRIGVAIDGTGPVTMRRASGEPLDLGRRRYQHFD